MADRIVFLDVESTGLHAQYGHRPWEVAIVELDGSGQTWLWRPADAYMYHADDDALAIGGFHTRAPDKHDPDAEGRCALEVAEALDQAVIAGSNPSFDMQMVGAWLRDWGCEPSWHWRGIDVPQVAAGWLAAYGDHVPVPFNSRKVTDRLGVRHVRRHEAWADADWCRRMWLTIGASDVA
jgi:hypothetical protein